MHKESIIVGVYSALILIGGVMGFVVAHSKASLFAGVGSSLILFLCNLGIYKKQSWGLIIAFMFSIGLALFFGYRYYLTMKWMPAGFMAFVSLIVIAYLGNSLRKLKTIKPE